MCQGVAPYPGGAKLWRAPDRRPESGVIGEPENYHLGLAYPDRRKKLVFFVVQRLVTLVWDKSGAPHLSLRLPFAPRRTMEYALDGAVRPGPEVAERQLQDVQLVAGEVRIFQFTP